MVLVLTLWATLQAYDMVQKGKAVMVDVRAAWNYENEHIEGAVSMPLFRGVEGKTPWDTAKRLVMTIGFAMKATGGQPWLVLLLAQHGLLVLKLDLALNRAASYLL